jgi:hypothetical protein
MILTAAGRGTPTPTLIGSRWWDIREKAAQAAKAKAKGKGSAATDQRPPSTMERIHQQLTTPDTNAGDSNGGNGARPTAAAEPPTAVCKCRDCVSGYYGDQCEKEGRYGSRHFWFVNCSLWLRMRVGCHTLPHVGWMPHTATCGLDATHCRMRMLA